MRLFLLESDWGLLLAREATLDESVPATGFPKTLDLSAFPILGQVLSVQKGLVIGDTADHPEWRPGALGVPVRSWIGVGAMFLGGCESRSMCPKIRPKGKSLGSLSTSKP